jgi:integrase/recombinase XerD
MYKPHRMKQVLLEPLLHRGQERIAIHFEKDKTLQDLIQKQAGAMYSKTHHCWYVTLNKENYEQLILVLKGSVSIEKSALRQYLAAKKKTTALKPTTPVIEEPSIEPVVTARPQPKQSFAIKNQIHAVNKHILPTMRQALVLKAYSPSTIKTYLNETGIFLRTIRHHPADLFNTKRIKDYLQFCAEKLDLSENTLHSRMNALKFYYEQVLNKDKFFFDIPRPKKRMILPKLLNETELRRLFNALTNKKHKAMLFTAYSAGLRVSEIVNLKIEDIDSNRMQIFICRAKGKKDRYVNLSPVLLDILRMYMSGYKPKPKIYLFESEKTCEAYPTRTVQQIFSMAREKAGISKTVGIHSLRHSFATHLLDKGTDIKYIKDILGHFNIRTTERYLHVSKKQLVNIISPFDDLWKKEEIDW